VPISSSNSTDSQQLAEAFLLFIQNTMEISSFALLANSHSKPVWHMPLLCVQWKTPDDGQRDCPKHVEFHSKNKFEKLVHLVGFIIRNLTWCTVTWTSEDVLMSQFWKVQDFYLSFCLPSPLEIRI